MAYLGKVELFCYLGAVVEMHVPYSSTQIRKDFGTTLAPDGKFPLVNAEKYSVRFSSHISKGSNFTLCGRPIIIHYAFWVTQICRYLKTCILCSFHVLNSTSGHVGHLLLWYGPIFLTCLLTRELWSYLLPQQMQTNCFLHLAVFRCFW